MAATLYCYEKCSTCRSARNWLDGRKATVKVRPIVDEPPSVAELRDLVKRSGLPLAKCFNTSGLSYRALGKEKISAMSDTEKLAALAADGKLIKRPILDDGKTVLVGFDAAEYAQWAKA
jgi:arsenate reductase (glutaredoxin)